MKRIWFFIWLLLSQSLFAQDPFAACFSENDGQNLTREELVCIYGIARTHDQYAEGVNLIKGFLDRFPEDPWLLYYYGHFELKTDRTNAGFTLEKAAEFFRIEGMLIDAFKAYDRGTLAFGRIEQTESLARIEQKIKMLVDEAQDPILSAYDKQRTAGILITQGNELDQAISLLAEAYELAFPGGPVDLELKILKEQSRVGRELSLEGLVLRSLTRFTEIATASGNPYDLALAHYRWAILAAAEPPTDENRQIALEKATLAYELAKRDGGYVRIGLAAMLMGRLHRGEARQEYLKEVVTYAQRSLDPAISSMAKALLGQEFGESDRELAMQYLEEAIQESQQVESIPEGNFGWEMRMNAYWRLLQPEEALDQSLQELALIEAMREFQSEERTQIRLFNVWSGAFFWLSGRLQLEWETQPDFNYLDQAFQLAERVRARGLLETLSQEKTPLPQAREDIAKEMRKFQLQNYSELVLQSPSLAKTAAFSQKIGSLIDRREASLPSEVPTEQRGSQNIDFASLEHVQANLADDEALLAFQLLDWENFYGNFGGGSWLMSVTKESVQAYPLADYGDLTQKLELFLGLVENADRLGEVEQVVGLIYDALFDEALEQLPPEIKHLLIIPDKILHKVPFGLLKAKPSDPVLAEAYQLTTIPSATLWLKWQGQHAPVRTNPALSLSDPSLPDTKIPRVSSSMRGRESSEEVSLGRLPFARLEGKALIQHLGGTSRLLLGDKASEAFIKKADLSQYSLLHFAAHALVGEEVLRDSAVVLASGEGEDGWLRPSEILDLNLNGQLVVLSACQSASGEVYQGEGVMSLGRAFFQAGAQVVIGSLWKLRDDDAAHLFEAFYRHLAKGLSVSQAMRQAQLERINAGGPVTSWSGVTVVGNGDLVPFPGGRSQQPSWLPIVLLGIAFSLIVGFVLAWRRGATSFA